MSRFLLALLTVAGLVTACTQPVKTDQESAEPVAAAEPAPITTYGDASNFSSEPTVFVTGANRGIGLEFVKQFSDRGWNIIATARKPEKADELRAIADGYDRLVIERLDVTNFERVDELDAKYATQPIDVLLSNAAITPKYKSAFRPVSGIDWDMARKSLEVNAIAPLKIAQAFMDQVEASEQKKVIVISSKAGSFELSPKMPMMYEYRGSKAALNMYFYTLQFEKAAKSGVTVVMLSPGQVNTMKGMPRPIAIETDESVSKMLIVIDGLSPENNGQFLDYEDGRQLAW
jgi:NAD(P)-dependent dehydrogenase (short-subunit alcohol dehydrogenase family)